MKQKNSNLFQTYIIKYKKRTQAILSFIIILAAFMSWANILGLTGVSGVKGIGLYTLLAGVCLLIIIFTSKNNVNLISALSFFVLIISVYAILTVNSVSIALRSIYTNANAVLVGEGAIITCISSILILILSIIK